jgi:glutamine synthetase
LFAETDQLSEAFDGFPEEDPARTALYAQETLKPVMESARAVADQLEGVVDRRLWPFPTYSELLHGHQ